MLPETANANSVKLTLALKRR